MDYDDQDLTGEAGQSWWHATICFPGSAGVTPQAAAALSAALAGQRYHFLRKNGALRLRTGHPAGDVLDQLAAAGMATGWTGGIYEPETCAFGGPAAMAAAHDLFCADSPAALAQTGSPHSAERCILLLSAMYRAAGLDPFETGDVWAKIAALRPPNQPPAGPDHAAASIAMRRLMNADAARRDTAEPGWASRVAAFGQCGHQVAELAATGVLTRGLRAVLAHHALFAFNRAGVPLRRQAAAAWLGQHAAFDDTGPAGVFTGPAAAAASTLLRMDTVITSEADPAALRAGMVSALTTSRILRTPAITDAFRRTERHEFIPDASLQAAYADDAVPTKHDGNGEMISCISAPSVVAIQLEQLGVQPGDKILEAGAATGYNAALLAQLAAPGGHVWTADVDQDLVEAAARNLAAAGITNATVMLADGAAGLPGYSPFNRIQFTVGAGDIPVDVLDQLAPGGRLVIPLRVRGSIARSFAFERAGDGTWTTVSCEMASFVPLRKGICDDARVTVTVEGGGNVRLDTYSEQHVDREAMRTILDQPSAKTYTGVKFRQGSAWEWVYLWLACVLPSGLSRMPGQRPGFSPHFGWGSMAAVDDASLAYLTVREGDDDQGRYWEIGVIGHGPRAAGLAGEVAAAITEWDRDYGNDASAPGFRMATGSARTQLTARDPRFIIDKPASRLVTDWP